MTIFWVTISIVGFLMWMFSLFAAFLLGQTMFVRAQMAHKAVIAHELRNAWEGLLLTFSRGGDDDKA